MAVVHQLLNRFRRGDPETESALRLQMLLRRLGHWGELVALVAPRSDAPLVRSLDTVRLRTSDWVLGHHAGASALTARLLLLGCNRALVLDASPAGDRASRAQLAALGDGVAFSLAPSAAAAQLLTAAGHRRVLPLLPFVEVERFRSDAYPAAPVAGGGPVVVCTTTSVHRSGPSELLAFQRELRRLRPGARLLVLGGLDPGDTGVRASLRAARRQPGLRLLGAQDHARRVAALRSAHLFLSLAEDDLAGTDLLEAMAADCPVLAYRAAAAAEVLGGAGLSFDEKRFAVLAELALRLTEDAPLRARLLAGQRRRLATATPEAAEAGLRKALAEVTLEPARRPRLAGRRTRPRVAVLVQRYGDVTGGAEALARSVVKRLSRHWEITVLTSCATDHLSWANVLPPGRSRLDGIELRRFPTRQPRDTRSLNALSRRLFGRNLDRGDEDRWLAMQGPLLPGLWRHLAEEGDRYDGFVAFTYLYALTAWAVPLVGARTLLVPTAHDEPPLAFGTYREVFERPRALLVNTPEELQLIARRFPRHARARVVGAGVEAPRVDPARFRRSAWVDRPYLLYLGRIEAGKGIPELLAFHRTLRESDPDAPDLLLGGAASLRAEGPGVRLLGRISERDKWDALAGATAVVVPSPLESLSLLALEAFAVGTPVVGNARSDVVRGQLRRSGAGRTYHDATSFLDAVRAVSQRRAAFGTRGRAFARKHRWSDVVQAYRQEMDRLREGP